MYTDITHFIRYYAHTYSMLYVQFGACIYTHRKFKYSMSEFMLKTDNIGSNAMDSCKCLLVGWLRAFSLLLRRYSVWFVHIQSFSRSILDRIFCWVLFFLVFVCLFYIFIPSFSYSIRCVLQFPPSTHKCGSLFG